MTSPEARLAELGVTLPTPPAAAGASPPKSRCNSAGHSPAFPASPVKNVSNHPAPSTNTLWAAFSNCQATTRAKLLVTT